MRILRLNIDLDNEESVISSLEKLMEALTEEIHTVPEEVMDKHMDLMSDYALLVLGEYEKLMMASPELSEKIEKFGVKLSKLLMKEK